MGSIPYPPTSVPFVAEQQAHSASMNGKSNGKSTPIEDAVQASQVSRDEKLRTKLDWFIASHQQLTDTQYQYQISKLLSGVECTDTGNAIRFYARYGQSVRYVAKWGVWYVWNGIRWVEDYTEQIKARAKSVGAYLEMEADLVPLPLNDDGMPLMSPSITSEYPTPEQKILLDKFAAHDAQVAIIKKWGKASRSDKGIKAMISLLKSEPGITIVPTDLDSDDYLFNMRNGTFDLRTFKLLPHQREHLITKLAPIDYDPTAACEVHWSPFVHKAMMGKPGLVRFLQQIFGMGLSGVVTDDIFPIHHGIGGNGKTVGMMTLHEMMGDYSAVAEASIFIEKQHESISNDIAALAGVRFLIASETDDNKHLNEALVKRLTGGDPITARFLRQEFFTFKPKFTASLLTNPKPVIKGIDNGIWRRVKFIPWNYNFENDPESVDKPIVLARMRTELSGIFNWCLEGYRDRMENGLQVPAEIVEATNAYRVQSDIIGSFIEECCVLGKHEEVDTKELYKAYQDYMQPTGHNAFADNRFGEKIRERQLHDPAQRKSGPKRYWLGIRLKTQEEKNDEIAKAYAEERAHARENREQEIRKDTDSPEPVSTEETSTDTGIEQLITCPSCNRIETYRISTDKAHRTCTECFHHAPIVVQSWRDTSPEPVQKTPGPERTPNDELKRKMDEESILPEKYFIGMQQARETLAKLPVDYIALDGIGKKKEQLTPTKALNYLSDFIGVEKYRDRILRTIEKKLPIWEAAAQQKG